MPGWVDYFYKDGVIPTHTKQFFNKSKILTVQNVILKNMLIFMNKIHNYTHMLPQSVSQTIALDSPSPLNNTDYKSDWYAKYNSIPYVTSTFYKGPILYNSIITDTTDLNNKSTDTFKKSLKTYLLGVQGSGFSEEWCAGNFKLINPAGLRSSSRIKNQSTVNYAEF